MDYRIRALLIVAIVVIAGVAVLVPSPPPRHDGWAGQQDAIWIADYNGIMVNLTLSDLGSYLRPGDGVAVVLTNYSNFPHYNQEAQNLSKALPFVTLRGYSGLDGGLNVSDGLADSIGAISPLYTQLSADYEVRGPIEFNPNGTAAVRYFTNFSDIVRDSGRYSIAYPSGRGVYGDYSGSPDNWNYSKFAGVTDGQTIETQGFCAGSQASWIKATQDIWKEYNASGQSISTLSLQISLGVGGNGANASQAIACAQYWRGVAHGNLFFWWGPQYETELIQILQAIGR